LTLNGRTPAFVAAAAGVAAATVLQSAAAAASATADVVVRFLPMRDPSIGACSVLPMAP
jgi:hypothetical protein